MKGKQLVTKRKRNSAQQQSAAARNKFLQSIGLESWGKDTKKTMRVYNDGDRSVLIGWGMVITFRSPDIPREEFLSRYPVAPSIDLTDEQKKIVVAKSDDVLNGERFNSLLREQIRLKTKASRLYAKANKLSAEADAFCAESDRLQIESDRLMAEYNKSAKLAEMPKPTPLIKSHGGKVIEMPRKDGTAA